MEELAPGQFYGVFIDDTGSPGTQATVGGPHPERFSWVAVVIPPSQMPEIIEQMPGAVKGLKELVGASEFHCRDIVQGEKEFENVPLRLRLGILEFLAQIFSSYRFPIFVQTFDPKNLADIHRREPGFRELKLRPFDFSKPSHAALFFLLMRIRKYLVEKQQPSGWLARLFADQGSFVKGSKALRLPIWKDAFADGLLCFADSATVLPLQLADFAAYAMNRHQILLGRQNLSEMDQALLAILTKAAFNFQNIPIVSANAKDGAWDFGPLQ